MPALSDLGIHLFSTTLLSPSDDIKWMQRCLELAKNGLGSVAPNPMVGCVIVHNHQVIGEGYHEKYGEGHAEVNAVRQVKDHSLLKEATAYVSLEPCAHFGKTPPCADMLIEKGLKRVVIASRDPFPEVDGKGMEKLRKAGIDVDFGVLEEEALELNARFFTFHQQHRPYVILKWAQSEDGFIDIHRKSGDGQKPTKISGKLAQRLVHQWRGQEPAIMVGAKTALLDNPRLDVRFGTGPNPVRVVLDQEGELPEDLHLFDGSTPTLIFTEKIKENRSSVDFISIDFKANPLQQVLNSLAERKLQSIFIEGGKQLLQSFIDAGLWDEARVFTNPRKLNSGVKAPQIPSTPAAMEQIEDDQLSIYRNL